MAIAAIIACSCWGEIATAQNYREVDSRDRLGLTQPSSQGTDYLSKILLIAGLASGAGFIGWRLSQYRQSGSSGSLLKSTKQREKSLLERVNPRLRRKLLRLINDPKTVNRLLMGIKQHHPHRSPDWMAEKVIYDFQRGR